MELARAFANTIWPRFSVYVTSASRLEEDKARTRQEREEIGRAIKAVSAGLPVLKVKIYDLEGLTVYSSFCAVSVLYTHLFPMRFLMVF